MLAAFIHLHFWASLRIFTGAIAMKAARTKLLQKMNGMRIVLHGACKATTKIPLLSPLLHSHQALQETQTVMAGQQMKPLLLLFE